MLAQGQSSSAKRGGLASDVSSGLIFLRQKHNKKQSNLQIQCNPYQNSNSIFHKNRKNYPKINMEPQKTLNSQSNLEKEQQSWRHHTSDFRLCYKAVIIKPVWFVSAVQSVPTPSDPVYSRAEPCPVFFVPSSRLPVLCQIMLHWYS